MKMLLLVCVLALLTFASVDSKPNKDNDDSRLLKDVIAPVYARYVVCYSCGSGYNKSQRQCDNDIKAMLKRVCARGQCTFLLDKRLERLRQLLTLKYQTKPRRWCGAGWVKKYI